MDTYLIIQKHIINGTFKPGERLTEQNLAEMFSVSRTPIRQALKQLENDGLVTPLKKGYIVRTFTESDIVQIYNLRALLEGYAAAQAAIHRSQEDLHLMKQANDIYSTIINKHPKSSLSLEEVQKIMEANRLFHDAIINAAKNDYLQFHLKKLVIVPLVFRSFYWYDKYELKRSYQSHETILQAIAQHDVDRAKTALVEHIFQGRDHVLKHFDQLQELLKEESDD